MVSEEQKKLARGLFQADLADRRRKLERGIVQISHEMAGLASLRSTSTAVRIHDLCRSELKILVDLAWASVRQVHQELSYSKDPTPARELAQDLMALVDEFVREEYVTLEVLYEKKLQNTHKPRHLNLAQELETELSSVKPRVELHAARFATHREHLIPGSSLQINIGAIQTGDHAQANIESIIQHREELVATLQQISKGQDTDQSVAEAAEEAIVELQKPNPNQVKLAGLISAVAGATQFAGSLRPAYDALVGAARAMGLLIGSHF